MEKKRIIAVILFLSLILSCLYIKTDTKTVKAYTDSDFTFYDISLTHNGEVVGSDDTVTLEVKLNSTFDNKKEIKAGFAISYNNNGYTYFNSETVDLINISENIYRGNFTLKNNDLTKKDPIYGKYFLTGFYCKLFNTVYNEILNEYFDQYYFTYTTPGEISEKYNYKQYCFYYSDECKNSGTHQFDEGKTTKYASETEEGVKTYTCERCGYEKTEIIPKIEIISGIEIIPETETLSKEIHFTLIKPVAPDGTLKMKYSYTGQPIEPEFIAYYKDEIIPKDDYIYTYEDNIEIGLGKIIVKSNTDSVTQEFEIIPQSVKIIKIKTTKNTAKITWEKSDNIKYYQFYISTQNRKWGKNFGYIKCKGNKTTATFKNLKKNKKYFLFAEAVSKGSDNHSYASEITTTTFKTKKK